MQTGVFEYLVLVHNHLICWCRHIWRVEIQSVQEYQTRDLQVEHVFRIFGFYLDAGIGPVIFDKINGSHDIIGLNACRGLNVKYLDPIVDGTCAFDNPVTEVLQCRRFRLNRDAQEWVTTDICDPVSSNAPTEVQWPIFLRTRIMVVPWITFPLYWNVLRNGVSQSNHDINVWTYIQQSYAWNWNSSYTAAYL